MSAADARTAREILEARARALATPVRGAETDEGTGIFTFALAGERFGLPAVQVLGTFRLVDMAVLPGAPPVVAGVTLWRGDLLTVLDLRHVLGLPTAGLDDRAWVVAVGDGARKRGVLAGTVSGVERIPATRAAEVDGEGTEGAPVRGVTASGLQLLDPAALLRLELRRS